MTFFLSCFFWSSIFGVIFPITSKCHETCPYVEVNLYSFNEIIFCWVYINLVCHRIPYIPHIAIRYRLKLAARREQTHSLASNIASVMDIMQMGMERGHWLKVINVCDIHPSCRCVSFCRSFWKWNTASM